MLGCALLAVTGARRPARAQQPTTPPTIPELRVDLITGDRAAVQLGAGIQIPIGYYVRVGLVGAAGVRIDSHEGAGPGSSRVDVLARFLIDPFRQSPYGLSLGGGITLRADGGDRVRPALLVAMDAEGRRAGGWTPAVQLGLGGGARIGLVMRRGAPGGR